MKRGQPRTPTTGQSRKWRKKAPQNGDGVEPEQSVHGTKEGEKSDPSIKKAKWQKRKRVTRGLRPAGTCTAEAPAPARGRRRPKPQGSDKSPGRVALPPPAPPSPDSARESDCGCWDLPEGSTRPPSPAGPPSAAPDPDRAPRRGASPKPTPGGRALGLGPFQGRSAALQTEPERKACKTKATGNWGGESGRGPYLMVAGLCCSSGRCRSLRAFSSALRSFAAERRRACVCVGARAR